MAVRNHFLDFSWPFFLLCLFVCFLCRMANNMFFKIKTFQKSLLFHDHKFHVTLKIYKLFSKQNYIKCKVTLKLQEFVTMSSCGEVWLVMEVREFSATSSRRHTRGLSAGLTCATRTLTAIAGQSFKLTLYLAFSTQNSQMLLQFNQSLRDVFTSTSIFTLNRKLPVIDNILAMCVSCAKRRASSGH